MLENWFYQSRYWFGDQTCSKSGQKMRLWAKKAAVFQEHNEKVSTKQNQGGLSSYIRSLDFEGYTKSSILTG